MESKIQEIQIYKSEDGTASLEVTLKDETVWLSLNSMSKLFGRDKSVISRHIRNIFSQGELKKSSVIAEFATTASDGKTYDVEYYNLDMIISVGYRVNSKRGTQFRIWATNVLRDHIVKGYTLNQKRLQEQQQKRLKELEAAVALVKSAQLAKELTAAETAGLLSVVTDYARTWLLLHEYDSGSLTQKNLTAKVRYELNYTDARKAVAQLKTALLKKKEASGLFGVEREAAFKAILGNINQTFGGKELYPTVEEKAAHLLYFLIKDHPFTDGNKRIASLIFIWFLEKNNALYTRDGNKKFNDNALVALALLVAESNPKQKELMINLIINLIHHAE